MAIDINTDNLIIELKLHRLNGLKELIPRNRNTKAYLTIMEKINHQALEVYDLLCKLLKTRIKMITVDVTGERFIFMNNDSTLELSSINPNYLINILRYKKINYVLLLKPEFVKVCI